MNTTRFLVLPFSHLACAVRTQCIYRISNRNDQVTNIFAERQVLLLEQNGYFEVLRVFTCFNTASVNPVPNI